MSTSNVRIRRLIGRVTSNATSVMITLLFFQAAYAETEWDVNRGWFTALVDGRPALVAAQGPAAEITVDDQPLIGNRSIEYNVSPKANGVFEVTCSTSRGTLIDRYEPFEKLGNQAWLRTLTYTNDANKPQDLHGAVMRLAPVLEDVGRKWQPRNFWMASIGSGQIVCISFRGSSDAYQLNIDRHNCVTHRVTACWRLGPGESASIGSQGIWLAQDEPRAFRREAQRWYQAIDLHVPTDIPDWLADTILYEVCAGGHLESRFSDVGGFDRLRGQVDYLADLGITAVWLQAPHQHKSPLNAIQGGWNHYDPRDFSRIDPILGGDEALHRLTAAFRARGIRVFGELVPHGGKSVQAQSLKHWWTYNRQGDPARNWGGCAMDYSSPEWQSEMRQAAARLSRDYGMVGARIDVADGSGPNWKSPVTNHASFSTLGGARQMLQAIRDGMASSTPHPVLIPESSNTVEFFSISPIGYGHPGWFLMGRDVPPKRNCPTALVDLLKQFYETQRGSLPTGARILRTLNNHDTVAHFGRSHFRYCAGLANALYGVCLMVPGIPMMYQEEEIGCYATRRQLNWARRRIPEFARGSVDYAAVAFAPEVFTCLRQLDDGIAIGLSNLSGEVVSGQVQFVNDVVVPEEWIAYDAVSGRQAVIRGNGFRWSLEPYQVSLIRLNAAPIEDVPDESFTRVSSTPVPERQIPELQQVVNSVRILFGQLTADIYVGDGDWSVEHKDVTTWQMTSDQGNCRIRQSGNAFDIEISIDLTVSGSEKSLKITFHGADRWQVSARTALLEDRALRRHYSFPADTDYDWDRTMAWGVGPHDKHMHHLSPTGRLWESMLEPLHPERPAWSIQDSTGKAICFAGIESNAENIVLTEPTESNTDLTFRVYAIDRDLSPRFATVGWEPWTMDTYPRAVPDRLFLRCRILCGDSKEMGGELSAPRRPTSRLTSSFTKGQGRVNETDGVLWLVDPGTLTWSNLKPPIEGLHPIQFELRHSETSPTGQDLEDAYEIRIDGNIVPVSWIKRDTWHTGNAYFGYAVTAPLDLAVRGRDIEIHTRKPWCAVRGPFHVRNKSNATSSQ